MNFKFSDTWSWPFSLTSRNYNWSSMSDKFHFSPSLYHKLLPPLILSFLPLRLKYRFVACIRELGLKTTLHSLVLFRPGHHHREDYKLIRGSKMQLSMPLRGFRPLEDNLSKWKWRKWSVKVREAAVLMSPLLLGFPSRMPTVQYLHLAPPSRHQLLRKRIGFYCTTQNKLALWYRLPAPPSLQAHLPCRRTQSMISIG